MNNYVKNFDDFIKESKPMELSFESLNLHVYGDSMFEGIAAKINYNVINESLTESIILSDFQNVISLYEGLFDKIAGYFGKKAADAEEKINNIDDDVYKNKVVDIKSASDFIKNQVDRDIQEKVIAVCASIEDTFNTISSKYEDEKTAVADGIKELSAQYDDFCEKFGTAVSELIEGATDKLSALYVTLVAAFVKCKELAKAGLEKLAKVAKGVGKGILTVAILPFILLVAVYKTLSSLAKKIFEGAKQAAKDAKEAIEKAIKAFKAVKDEVVKYISDSIKTVWDKIKEIAAEVKEDAEAFGEWCAAAWELLAGAVADGIKDAAEAIKEVAVDFAKSVKEMGGKIADGFSAGWKKVSDWAKDTKAAVADGVKTAAEKVKGWFGDLVNKAKEGAQAVADGAKAAFDSAKKLAGDAKDDAFKKMQILICGEYGKDTIAKWLDDIYADQEVLDKVKDGDVDSVFA